MRYERNHPWTPVPFSATLTKAGAGLLVPPTVITVFVSLLFGMFWLLGSIWPTIKSHAKPWPEHWVSMYLFIAYVLWMLITQELAVINGETVSFQEMVGLRLASIEKEQWEQFVKANPELFERQSVRR